MRTCRLVFAFPYLLNLDAELDLWSNSLLTITIAARFLSGVCVPQRTRYSELCGLPARVTRLQRMASRAGAGTSRHRCDDLNDGGGQSRQVWRRYPQVHRAVLYPGSNRMKQRAEKHCAEGDGDRKRGIKDAELKYAQVEKGRAEMKLMQSQTHECNCRQRSCINHPW